jgi:hypothetical protein
MERADPTTARVFTAPEVEALRSAIARALREAKACVQDVGRAHECMEEALLLSSIRRKLALL